MKQKILKSLIKIVTFLVTFVGAVLISDRYLNLGNTDMTTDMGVATLPIVYLNVNDEYINPLHGYTMDMEGSYLRGVITPLKANREIEILIDTYGAVIGKVGFEVRSKDMQRLIEDTVVEGYSYEESMITATIPIKNLIEAEKEYMLVIKLTAGSGNVIKYYTRIINKPELYLTEKMQFVRDFSAKTLDKEAARELRKYMETNAEGDNSSYGYVDIHSNFKQLTWGDLQPIVSSEKELWLLEVDSLNACIELTYRVFIKNESYNVREYFRIKRGSDRIYLMEYERRMNQVFDEDKEILVNGKILHGILNEKLQWKENKIGNIYCFVQENALYSFNAVNNTLAKVFSFYDKDNNDIRTRFKEHGIKIMSVDDGGDITFLVYGYMNRGLHEGEVGACIYQYDAAVNTVEEELFLPYTKSYQMLKQEVEALGYVNSKNMFFILLDGSVYRINVDTKSVETIATGVDDNRFVSAVDNSIIAWQTGSAPEDYQVMKYYSLEASQPIELQAQSGEMLIPLGFMEEDLVLGLARLSDVTTNATGNTVMPMYAIRIQNVDGEVQKEYRRENVFIMGVEIQDNMITLHRSFWNDEMGFFEETSADQIMNNQPENVTKNQPGSVVTEEMETTYQTSLAKMPPETKRKNLTSKQVLFEGRRDIATATEDPLERYYVYAKGEIVGIYTNPAEAIMKADGIFGTVVDKRDSYLWQGGNRYLSKTIRNIEVQQSDPLHSSTALCVNEMLKVQGVSLDARTMLSGKTVFSVLQENLDGATVLDLTGCSMKTVYYYVSCGIPVLAMVEDGESVLITGYDSSNTTIYNPKEGTNDKYGDIISAEWFQNNGNRFITYIMTKQ